MAEINPPYFLQGGSHSAQVMRSFLSALVGQDVETFAGGVSANGPGHGLAKSGHLAVTEKSGTPDMSVDVAAGYAFITGTSSLAQGVYAVCNDAVKNVAIAEPDPTNPRNDLIVAEIRDVEEDGGSDNDWILRSVTGTPAAIPTDPTVPSDCLVLARVVVTAADASITNSQITALAGLARGSNWNQAWGVVARAVRTSNAGPIAAETDIGGMSATWVAVAGRRYKVSLTTSAVNTDIDSLTVVKITDSSNVQKARALDSASTLFGFTLNTFVTETHSAGSVTRKVRAALAAGTGSTTLEGSADAPMELLVEDIGPA